MPKRTGWSTESRHLRGYGTEWYKTRERILRRDFGICQPCLKKGMMHRGNEVDHIISRAEGKRRGLPDSVIESDDNLQTICTESHKIKTAVEQGKTLKRKIEINDDGFPKGW